MQRLRGFVASPVLAIVTITVLAGALRFSGLGDPPDRIFDEVYYTKAGCLFVGFDRSQCAITSDPEKTWADSYNDTGSWVHPPLGKWAIGVGQLLFGRDAFGWRFVPALAGALMAGLIALLAFLLWRRAVWAWIAGLLMATEHLSFVQSRIATLDGLLAFWVVLAFIFVVLDRGWVQRRTDRAIETLDGPDALLPIAGGSTDVGSQPEPSPPSHATPTQGVQQPVLEDPGRVDRVPSPIWRPWRFAAGIALGAAVATKWSGALALLAAIVVSVGWERTRRYRAWEPHPVRRAVVEESFGIVLAFVLLPLLVYWASYIGYFLDFGWSPAEWLRLQGRMFSFSRELDPLNGKGEPIHPYLSAAWQWILDARPIAYFVENRGEIRREILAVGNPVVFWTSLVALPALAIAWRRARDWTAGFLLIVIAVQLLPWMVIERPKFFFYIAPIAPFLVLAVTWLVRQLARWRIDPQEADDDERGVHPLLPVAALIVLGSVAAFIWFWPVLTGDPLTLDQWQLRIWFDGTTWSRFNWV
ncbi:MAG: phospholipid carrier-dependent glycosyltransferase [Actinomycetota bacterium]